MNDLIGLLPPSEPYLRILRLGVDVWNRWTNGEYSSNIEKVHFLEKLYLDQLPRRDRQVDFSSVDFTNTENEAISFSKARFTNGVDFEKAIFGEKTNFSQAEFNGDVLFISATFSQNANFEGTRFSNGCDFTKATFEENANFHKAHFGAVATFSEATFGSDATFSECVFTHKPKFIDCHFGVRANFSKAQFHRGAHFNNSTFKYEGGSEDTAYFNGAIFDEAVSFNFSHFEHKVNFTDCAFKKGAYFEYANFHSDALFDDAKFHGTTIFANASFHQPPDFEGCEGDTRFDVVGIRVTFSGTRPKYRWWKEKTNYPEWTINTDVPTRLRRFRKLMDDAKAQDIEHDLFILERKAERGIKIHNRKNLPLTPSPFGSIVLLWFYSFFSDCGRSATRPFLYFIANIAASYYLYFILYTIKVSPAPLMQMSWKLCCDIGKIPEKPLFDILSFTIGHALPLIGSLSAAREAAIHRLFSNPLTQRLEMPFSIELAAICQSIIGAILFFLMLLAIRNHFRIR